MDASRRHRSREDERISRRLSRILRYERDRCGAAADADGFVSLRELCARHFRHHAQQEVRRAAESSLGSRGNRFELHEHPARGPLIRVFHEAGRRADRRPRQEQQQQRQEQQQQRQQQEQRWGGGSPWWQGAEDAGAWWHAGWADGGSWHGRSWQEGQWAEPKPEPCHFKDSGGEDGEGSTDPHELLDFLKGSLAWLSSQGDAPDLQTLQDFVGNWRHVRPGPRLESGGWGRERCLWEIERQVESFKKALETEGDLPGCTGLGADPHTLFTCGLGSSDDLWYNFCIADFLDKWFEYEPSWPGLGMLFSMGQSYE